MIGFLKHEGMTMIERFENYKDCLREIRKKVEGSGDSFPITVEEIDAISEDDARMLVELMADRK